MDRTNGDRGLLRRCRLGLVAVAVVCAPVWTVLTFVAPSISRIFGAVLLIVLGLSYRHTRALERLSVKPGPPSSDVDDQ